MNSRSQPSRLPQTLRQELQTDMEAKQAAKIRAKRCQSALLKTLLMLRGLGITLEQPPTFLMEAYEDEEQKQHVIVARWNLKSSGNKRGKVLFEFVFANGELTIRWFDKTVAANLPNTEERKAIDAKRWQALYHCFMDLHQQDKLPNFVGFIIHEAEQPKSAAQFYIGVRVSRIFFNTYDVDSKFSILQQRSLLIHHRYR